MSLPGKFSKEEIDSLVRREFYRIALTYAKLTAVAEEYRRADEVDKGVPRIENPT